VARARAAGGTLTHAEEHATVESPADASVPTSADLAQAIAGAALDKKAFEPVILDMRGLVDYTDVFVLVSASNARQVDAIAEEICKVARERFGVRPRGVEGRTSSRWVLVDFGDVIVHVFDLAMRGFYDLDTLWSDAPRLPVPSVAAPSEGPLFQLP
jgi:ribosome-associated protein